MATIGESSSSAPKSVIDEPVIDKPVIVRVKRKVSQCLLDAFWLEISERPSKRPLLDFTKLSISDSATKEEEFKTKKVLVRHMETVSSSTTNINVMQSFLDLSHDKTEGKARNSERRHTFKKDHRQDQKSKGIQSQQTAAKNARFEQIWRSRMGNKEAIHDDAVHEICRFYDIVRVDVEERSKDVKPQEDALLEDHRMLASYLPLLREFLPEAVVEVEYDINAMSTQDDYVYDYYTVKDGMDIDMDHEDASSPFPLVHVEDEDFYDGPDTSDYGTDDSNAEDNPRNDYPEELCEDEDDDDDDDDKDSNEDEDDDKEEEEVDDSSAQNSSDENSNAAYSDNEMYDDCYEDGDNCGFFDADDDEEHFF